MCLAWSANRYNVQMNFVYSYKLGKYKCTYVLSLIPTCYICVKFTEKRGMETQGDISWLGMKVSKEGD